MKALFFTIFFFSIFSFSSKTLIQESSESKITFKIKNMGIFVDGKFSDYSIDSNFNLNEIIIKNEEIQIEKLLNEELLDLKFKDHILEGNYVNHCECHIEPDFLLIYRVIDDVLILDRVGNHSNLFG